MAQGFASVPGWHCHPKPFCLELLQDGEPPVPAHAGAVRFGWWDSKECCAVLVCFCFQKAKIVGEWSGLRPARPSVRLERESIRLGNLQAEVPAQPRG